MAHWRDCPRETVRTRPSTIAFGQDADVAAGIPTEAVGAAEPALHYLVGTPKGRLSATTSRSAAMSTFRNGGGNGSCRAPRHSGDRVVRDSALSVKTKSSRTWPATAAANPEAVRRHALGRHQPHSAWQSLL